MIRQNPARDRVTGYPYVKRCRPKSGAKMLLSESGSTMRSSLI